MMHADLVDMEDFVLELQGVGLVCESHDASSVQASIEHWLATADDSDNDCFWDTLLRIEAEGILLPDVENLINWSHKYSEHVQKPN
ncbi:hypothetical protein [Vibrio palustris]|uniref:Uncharacterized protein n=1 Tax=Vibrio palustris TaxID=1918946 RepID=A0A1R4B4G9_9VIBR|nr:hypothetical protein [Vibrio palustris]SJL83818.1 hypothetical protein VPAL9027_01797 [Vibrio palustris]